MSELNATNLRKEQVLKKHFEIFFLISNVTDENHKLFFSYLISSEGVRSNSLQDFCANIETLRAKNTMTHQSSPFQAMAI